MKKEQKIKIVYNITAFLLLGIIIGLMVLAGYSSKLGYFNASITIIIALLLFFIIYMQVLNRKDILLIKYMLKDERKP
jgi:hypothetical protein